MLALLVPAWTLEFLFSILLSTFSGARLMPLIEDGDDLALAALASASFLIMFSNVALGIMSPAGLAGTDGPSELKSEKLVNAGDANVVIAAGDP